MDPKVMPKALIDNYVDEVTRRLPRRLRGDVGLELRSLLAEDLGARAATAGVGADEVMTLSLLRDFGAPETVAQRYRPEGITIIEPSQSRSFTMWALVGVAAQWAVTLTAALRSPEAFEGQTLARLGVWWTSWGLGAFWLPGVMVTVAIIAAWLRQGRPREKVWTPRRVVDRDSVNRPLMALALVGWAAGAALWIAMPWYGPKLPGALPMIFAFDDEFLRTRALWLLPLWAAHYAVSALALAEGRWRALTRRLDMGVGAAVCGVLGWFVVAGPVFRNGPTDDMAKFCVAVIVLLSLVWAGVRLTREPGRVAQA